MLVKAEEESSLSPDLHNEVILKINKSPTVKPEQA